MKVFPFTIGCTDSGCVHGDLRKIFLAHKPKDLVWYGFDTVVLSSYQVRFDVYDMHSNVYGGLGKIIANIEVVVTPSQIEEYVMNRILLLATEKRQAELATAEANIITRYMKEIRSRLP